MLCLADDQSSMAVPDSAAFRFVCPHCSFSFCLQLSASRVLLFPVAFDGGGGCGKEATVVECRLLRELPAQTHHPLLVVRTVCLTPESSVAGLAEKSFAPFFKTRFN